SIEEEIVGDQLVVLDKCMRASVKLVCAAFGNKLEIAAAVSTSPGIIKACLKLDLLKSLQRRCQIPRERASTFVDGPLCSVHPAAAAKQARYIDAVEYHAVVGG